MVGGEQPIGVANVFVSTVVVNDPRLGVVRMNASDYRADVNGAIISGPTLPPIPVGVSDPANFDPKHPDAPSGGTKLI